MQALQMVHADLAVMCPGAFVPDCGFTTDFPQMAETKAAMDKLSRLIAEAEAHEEGRDRAVFFRESVVPAMKALRKPVDELEMIVDKDMWPMPSYGDLIFEV